MWPGGGGGGEVAEEVTSMDIISMFISHFPRANRTFDDRVQTHDEYQDRVTP